MSSRATAGKPKQVTIKMPVLGAYSKTFPLNCAKSKIIIRRAAEFYSGKDRMKRPRLFERARLPVPALDRR